jgi:cytochrome bd-type quinol oxidase subunit 2
LAETTARPRRGDRSPWNWLLVLPVVVPLLTFVFNKDKPRLAGFPFFYWAQFAFIILGVGTTTVVYLMTRSGSDSKED